MVFLRLVFMFSDKVFRVRFLVFSVLNSWVMVWCWVSVLGLGLGMVIRLCSVSCGRVVIWCVSGVILVGVRLFLFVLLLMLICR